MQLCSNQNIEDIYMKITDHLHEIDLELSRFCNWIYGSLNYTHEICWTLHSTFNIIIGFLEELQILSFVLFWSLLIIFHMRSLSVLFCVTRAQLLFPSLFVPAWGIYAPLATISVQIQVRACLVLPVIQTSWILLKMVNNSQTSRFQKDLEP